MGDTTATDAAADIPVDTTADTAGQDTADNAADVQGDVTADNLEDTADDPEDPPGADALGDPGKKALDVMKQRARDERAKRQAAEKRAEAAEKALSLAKGEDEATVRQREADTAALAKANTRIAKAEVRGVAKGLLADPEDAFLHIDISEIEVGADGEVDREDITEKITDLIKRKPYLAAQRTPGDGAFDSGRGKPAAKSQLTRAQLAALPHAERLKAVEEGRVKLG